MHCVVRSVDQTVFEGEVERIVARTPHGEFAVLNGHAPWVAVLEPGVIRLLAAGTEQVLLTRGGTFELADNEAVLLVEQPHQLKDIDVPALKEQIEALQSQDEMTHADDQEVEYLELLCRVKESHD